MLERPNVQFFNYKDLEIENNLVNIDLVTEVYKSYSNFEFNGKEYKIYKITFLMVNNEEVVWTFKDKETRDLHYDDL